MKELLRKLVVIIAFSWLFTMIGFLAFILVKYIIMFLPSFVTMAGYIQVMLCITIIPAFLFLFGTAIVLSVHLFIEYIRNPKD